VCIWVFDIKSLNVASASQVDSTFEGGATMALTTDAIAAERNHPVVAAPEVAKGVSEKAQRLGGFIRRLPSRDTGPD